MCVIGSTSESVCSFVEYAQVIPLLEGYHESKNAQGTHTQRHVLARIPAYEDSLKGLRGVREQESE